MRGVNEVDRAFGALIQESEELLARGRARTPFSALRRQPQRLELDLAGIEEVQAPELSERARKEYAQLHRELTRFEPRALLFTSPEPGQGVSFTAHNLARMWCAKKKVLLLELYNGQSGLEYELPEGALAVACPQRAEEILRRCPASGLYLLSAHAPEAGGIQGELWLRLRSSFDLIVVDCSSFWHNALAAPLAPLTDGVILVCGHPPVKPVLDRLERDLYAMDGRFIGVIMNAVDYVHPAAQAS